MGEEAPASGDGAFPGREKVWLFLAGPSRPYLFDTRISSESCQSRRSPTSRIPPSGSPARRCLPKPSPSNGL